MTQMICNNLPTLPVTLEVVECHAKRTGELKTFIVTTDFRTGFDVVETYWKSSTGRTGDGTEGVGVSRTAHFEELMEAERFIDLHLDDEVLPEASLEALPEALPEASLEALPELEA